MIPGTLGRRQRRRRFADSGRRPERDRARQPQRRPAHHDQRRQHDDAAGRRQHRRPDAGHGVGGGGDRRHDVARRGPADRRRAHQLRAQGRRQPVHQLRRSSSFTNEQPAGRQLLGRAARLPGLGTPNKILHAYDINESLGGPFKRDKVWFWFSTRYQRRGENEAPVFENLNAFNPNEWLYVPDTSKPGVNKGEQFNNSIRVTWQATPRNKIAGTYKADKWCNCPEQHQRHAGAGSRARPPLPAPAPGARGVDVAGHQQAAPRSRRACTCSSAGATCTCASTAGSLDRRRRKRSSRR